MKRFAHHPKDAQKGYTISIKRLLTLVVSTSAIISLLVILAYMVLPEKEAVISPRLDRQPKHLFSIYGDEEKPLKGPMAVFVDKKGKIYVASTNNHELQIFKPNGRFDYSFGEAGSSPGQFYYPYGIIETEKGNLLVAETGNQRIQEITPHGKFVRLFAGETTPLKLEKPGPLFRKGDLICIGDLVKQQVVLADSEGRTVGLLQGINYPHGLWIDNDGDLLVSDAGAYRVVKFDVDGNEKMSIGEWQKATPFSMVRGVAVDSLGRIYVSDTINSMIRVFSSGGEYLFSFGKKGISRGEFMFPTGLFIDTKDRIYVVDWGNHRIEVWGYN